MTLKLNFQHNMGNTRDFCLCTHCGCGLNSATDPNQWHDTGAENSARIEELSRFNVPPLDSEKSFLDKSIAYGTQRIIHLTAQKARLQQALADLNLQFEYLKRTEDK